MNSRVRRMVLVGVMITALGVVGPAAAGHDHYLTTPGTCVEDIAHGQTSQITGGGAHQFHDNVHKGTPGMQAFANPNNPVSIDKGETCP